MSPPNLTHSCTMDALSIVEDEVALEGLDGITVPSLWIRLEGRTPKFPLKLDAPTKGFIWKALVVNGDLSFYKLPEERDDVVLTDRFADTVPEAGIVEAGEAPLDQRRRTDIYLPHIIVGDENGIQGSCATYKARKDVTCAVRSSVGATALLGLDEALGKFGRRLVIVASQAVRFRALIGPCGDPDLELADQSYCILERVGRARWQGELQRDLENSLGFDGGRLYYLRKSLLKNRLVTMQMYTYSRQHHHSVLLLLGRFHADRTSKYGIMMQSVSNVLADTPDQITTVASLRERLNVRSRIFRLLLEHMQSAKLVKVINVPAGGMQPNDGPCTTKRATKATARCLQLIKPFVKKELLVEDDAADDDDTGARTGVVDSSAKGRIMERDVLTQAYQLVLSTGTVGISQKAIGSSMNVGDLDARMICKGLERSGMIKTFMEDVGKQRVTKYISHKCESTCDDLKQSTKERNKLMSSSVVPHNKLQIPSTQSSASGSKSKGKHSTAVEKQAVSTVSPEVSLLQCGGRSKGSQASKPEQLHETYRLLKRKNMIVESVHRLKIIEGTAILRRIINDEEKKHGVTTKVCKKTVLRIIRSLSREGLAKLFTTTVVCNGINKKVDFVLHPSIQPDDAIVKSAIENACIQTGSSSISHTQQTKEEVKAQGNELGVKADKPVDFKPATTKEISRAWGYLPKMQRLRVVHTFLWYLLRGHPLQWSAGHSHSDLRVYVDEISWKRFIPPISVHEEFGSGWGLIEDILPCLPLSIFVQVIRIKSMVVDGLAAYLSDPVKRHCPVRHLPGTLKAQLLYKQNYVFSFHEHLQRLAYMGLLQFGPVEAFQEKQKAFVYVKKTSTIVDTTSSEPHYRLVQEPPNKPFERRRYTFTTVKDVETYWFELRCVSLNTQLGVNRAKKEMEGLPCMLGHGNIPRLAHLLKGNRKVCDDGSIPGDGGGAGGLDSCFHVHLKRNWDWITPGSVKVPDEPTSIDQQVARGQTQKRKPPRKVHDVCPPCKKTKVLDVQPQHKKTKELETCSLIHSKSACQPLKNRRWRFAWSAQEESLMLLCRVASHLLNRQINRKFLPYGVTRDLLHAEFKIPRDKTTEVVRTRMLAILKNPQTLRNYRVCLAEAYRDGLLMERLEEKKPADPGDPRECAVALSQFTRLLRQKFSSAASSHGVVAVPDTKAELFSRFNVYTIDEGKGMRSEDSIGCAIDIHAIVLNNLMQSTLLSPFQTAESFQTTFNIYSKYSQEVLRRVFVHCRKTGVIIYRRDNCRSKKSRALPVLPTSYQMSMKYFRCFMWRFPATLCTDVFRFVRTVDGTGAVDDGPFMVFHNEAEWRDGLGAREKEHEVEVNIKSWSLNTSTEAQVGDHVNPETQTPEEPQDISRMVQFPLDSPGGACAALLSLMTLGLVSVHVSIPKHVVMVDSDLVDDDTKCMATLEEDDREASDEADDGEAWSNLHPKMHQASHIKYLIMQGHCSPGIAQLHNLSAKDSIAVESCLIRVRMRNTPAHRLFDPEISPPLDFSECGLSLLPSVLTRSFRHRPPLDSPADAGDTHLIQRCGYTAQDVRACTEIRSCLDGAGENGLSERDLRRALEHLAETRPGSGRTLERYMHELQQQGHVLQVGGFGSRWVLMRHAGPWILRKSPGPQFRTIQEEQGKRHCFPARKRRRDLGDQQERQPPAKREKFDKEESKEQERRGWGKGSAGIALTEMAVVTGDASETDVQRDCEQRGGRTRDANADTASPSALPSTLSLPVDDNDNLSYISRPWRLEDGGLNGPACKGMLEAVLLHVMSRPGVTRRALLDHYKDVLQPMAVSELLRALTEMGCVRQRVLTRASAKPSLFSRPHTGLLRTTDAKRSDEECDAVFYEPTVGCCLRLARVLPDEANWNHLTQV